MSRPTHLAEVLQLEPGVFRDARGFVTETWNQRDFDRLVGSPVRFVQDNLSRSLRGVLRGLHYQVLHPQGKLVRVVRGAVWDVAVDMRRASPTFGRWTAAELSEENGRQLWIPAGFAHGFLVLSDVADVLYKMTNFYAPEFERTLAWDDPDVAVEWPLPSGVPPMLSEKDRTGRPLGQCEVVEWRQNFDLIPEK